MDAWTQASINELFVALVAAAFASFLLIYVYAEARRRKHLPPGPWPWPIVGNFPALGDLPHRSLQKLAAKYGGLMYLRLGTTLSEFLHSLEFFECEHSNLRVDE